MTTSRMEAFSDGVIAIIVTIMVLELRAPAQPTLPALWKVAPIFLSYGLSFLVVAIMWINHHHVFELIARGRIRKHARLRDAVAVLFPGPAEGESHGLRLTAVGKRFDQFTGLLK